MRIKNIFNLFLLAIFLVGCSDTEKSADEEKVKNGPVEQEDNKKDTSEEEQVDVVEDVLDLESYKVRDGETLMRLQPGIYGADNYDEAKVKTEIADFSPDISEDDYFASLLALVADDYRDLYEQIVNFDFSFDDPSEEPEGGNNSAEAGIPIGKEVNIVILLDASGSMRGEIDGDTKMVHAVNAIESFVTKLPPDVNVSLQVYGHKGTSNQSDKSLSCSSTEVVYELSPYDQEQFSTVLHDIEPAGWTPLAASIAATYEDLQAAEGMENIIYIVSDGVETCDGDPAEEAKKLNSSNIKAVVNIIGFDVDNAGQNELMAVAEAGKGKYMTVTSQQEMEEFFTSEQRELEKEWLQWQAENVSNYYKTELEKRKQVHAIKNAIYEKANEEMEKLLALTDFMQTELDLDA